MYRSSQQPLLIFLMDGVINHFLFFSLRKGYIDAHCIFAQVSDCIGSTGVAPERVNTCSTGVATERANTCSTGVATERATTWLNLHPLPLMCATMITALWSLLTWIGKHQGTTQRIQPGETGRALRVQCTP